MMVLVDENIQMISVNCYVGVDCGKKREVRMLHPTPASAFMGSRKLTVRRAGDRRDHLDRARRR
jgi:hypothetical protein